MYATVYWVMLVMYMYFRHVLGSIRVALSNFDVHVHVLGEKDLCQYVAWLCLCLLEATLYIVYTVVFCALCGVVLPHS